MPKPILKRIVAVILTLSLVGYSSAWYTTVHYHILADGRVIVHSHPLSKGRTPENHEHSRRQYAELDAAAQILDTIVIGSPEIPAMLTCPCGIAHIGTGLFRAFDPVIQAVQRAPPAVLHL